MRARDTGKERGRRCARSHRSCAAAPSRPSGGRVSPDVAALGRGRKRINTFFLILLPWFGRVNLAFCERCATFPALIEALFPRRAAVRAVLRCGFGRRRVL